MGCECYNSSSNPKECRPRVLQIRRPLQTGPRVLKSVRNAPRYFFYPPASVTKPQKWVWESFYPSASGAKFYPPASLVCTRPRMLQITPRVLQNLSLGFTGPRVLQKCIDPCVVRSLRSASRQVLPARECYKLARECYRSVSQQVFTCPRVL